MKEVKMYEAFDGKLFKTAEEACDYEKENKVELYNVVIYINGYYETKVWARSEKDAKTEACTQWEKHPENCKYEINYYDVERS